jgi:hypothetical protein
VTAGVRDGRPVLRLNCYDLAKLGRNMAVEVGLRAADAAGVERECQARLCAQKLKLLVPTERSLLDEKAVFECCAREWLKRLSDIGGRWHKLRRVHTLNDEFAWPHIFFQMGRSSTVGGMPAIGSKSVMSAVRTSCKRSAPAFFADERRSAAGSFDGRNLQVCMLEQLDRQVSI